MNAGQGFFGCASHRSISWTTVLYAGRLALGLAVLMAAPAQANEQSCQAVLEKTPECASFETHPACVAVLKQAPECKGVEGLSTWLCMHEIGRVVQRYFACKERPDSAPACPDLIVKVDKYGNKLDTLIGCKL